MVAVPPDTAVTVPFSTVATDVLFELHLTFWFVASEGRTVAVKVAVAPLTKDNSVWERVTPVTGTVTVTSHVAVRLPSSVVTVMVAAPPDTAVTVPFSTMATAVLVELHVTFWFVASEGATAAVKVAIAPFTKGNSVCESVTPETGIVTNTSQVETSFSWLPLAATVAVIVAFPVFSPFIVREAASIICTV